MDKELLIIIIEVSTKIANIASVILLLLKRIEIMAIEKEKRQGGGTSGKIPKEKRQGGGIGGKIPPKKRQGGGTSAKIKKKSTANR